MFDFAALAAAFAAPLQRERATIAASFEGMGRWLEKLVGETDKAERATRRLPYLRFTGYAVVVWLDRAQHGRLAPGGIPPSAADTFAAAIGKFVGGFEYVGRAVREARLLPEFFGAMRRAAVLIEYRVAQAIRMGPGTFDPARPRAASEVFGGLGLAAYAYYFPATDGRRGKDQITEARDLLARVRALGTALPWGSLADPLREGVAEAQRALFPKDQPAAPLVGPRPAAPAPALTFGEQLETVIRYTAGAILLLPLLPGLLLPMLDRFVYDQKVRILDELSGLETYVIDFRDTVLGYFYVDLPAFGQTVFDTLAVLGGMLVSHVRFLARFVVGYLRAAGEAVIQLVGRFVRFMGRLTILGKLIGDVIDAVLDLDVKDAALWATGYRGIAKFIGGDAVKELPSTLREVVEAMLSGKSEDVRDRLLPYMLERNPRRKRGPWGIGRVHAYRQVITGLIQDVGYVPTTPFPAYTGPAMPDFYKDLMGPDGEATIEGFVTEFGEEVRTRIDGLLGAGVVALDDAAALLRKEGERAAGLGSSKRYGRVAEWATELAENTLGGQVRALRERAEKGGGPMADAYADVLARGGFYLVEEVVPRYIEGLAAYAQERRLRQAEGRYAPPSGLPPYPAPTSPHLLDRRARLGRVRLPRLTLRAGTRPLDDDLAATVATRFKAEVEAAYTAGLARLPD